MSEFLEIMSNRYTTKKYDSSRKIGAEDLQQLKQIVRLSASSINSQPWHFTFVGDQKVKEELSVYSRHNTQKVLDASHVVVFSVLCSVAAFEKQIQEHLPEGAVGYYEKYIKGLPETEIQTWMAHQVYLALGFFLSACAVMGIDSTPMEGIDPCDYQRITGGDNYRALFAVAIGYRAQDDQNQPCIHPKQRLDETLLIDEI